MTTDVNVSDSDPEADGTDPQTETSKVNYESKYRGEARRNSSLAKQIEALQKEYDEVLSAKEKAESIARTATKDMKQKFDELQADLDKERKAREKSEKELAKVNSTKETRAKIKDKFPNLLEMFDDELLRNQEDFSKPEDFESYLTKLSGKVSPQKQEQTDATSANNEPDPKKRAAGSTPSIPASSHDGKKSRTKDQVLDDLFSIDPLKDENKYIQLQQEYDNLLAEERKR